MSGLVVGLNKENLMIVNTVHTNINRFAPMMKAARTKNVGKLLPDFTALQPRSSHLRTHRRENLKSYFVYILPCL
jgi:hypothetical protein